MGDLDELGARHRQLLKDLEDLKPLLAEAIRAEYAKGGPDAAYVSLAHRSGYRSIEGVKQIIDPDRRAKMNQDRRAVERSHEKETTDG
jgi:hypothetical protein